MAFLSGASSGYGSLQANLSPSRNNQCRLPLGWLMATQLFEPGHPGAFWFERSWILWNFPIIVEQRELFLDLDPDFIPKCDPIWRTINPTIDDTELPLSRSEPFGDGLSVRNHLLQFDVIGSIDFVTRWRTKYVQT